MFTTMLLCIIAVAFHGRVVANKQTPWMQRVLLGLGLGLVITGACYTSASASAVLIIHTSGCIQCAFNFGPLSHLGRVPLCTRLGLAQVIELVAYHRLDVLAKPDRWHVHQPFVPLLGHHLLLLHTLHLLQLNLPGLPHLLRQMFCIHRWPRTCHTAVCRVLLALLLLLAHLLDVGPKRSERLAQHSILVTQLHALSNSCPVKRWAMCKSRARRASGSGSAVATTMARPRRWSRGAHCYAALRILTAASWSVVRRVYSRRTVRRNSSAELLTQSLALLLEAAQAAPEGRLELGRGAVATLTIPDCDLQLAYIVAVLLIAARGIFSLFRRQALELPELPLRRPQLVVATRKFRPELRVAVKQRICLKLSRVKHVN